MSLLCLLWNLYDGNNDPPNWLTVTSLLLPSPFSFLNIGKLNRSSWSQRACPKPRLLAASSPSSRASGRRPRTRSSKCWRVPARHLCKQAPPSPYLLVSWLTASMGRFFELLLTLSTDHRCVSFPPAQASGGGCCDLLPDRCFVGRNAGIP